MILMIVFLLGLFIGSFLNVLVDRLPLNENPLVGRSHCDYCRKQLSMIDLVPLFSYIVLNGKCRYCKKKLSFYYPAVELVTGLLFMVTLLALQANHPIGAIYSSGFALELILNLLIVSVLTVIFFTDLKSGIIPFAAVVVGIILGLILHIGFPNTEISTLNYFFSGIVSFAGFFILYYLANLLAKGEGMGFGDVVYVFLMGLLLGFPQILLGLYIAFVSGGLSSLALVILRKKKFKGGTIPFGPFLVIGTLICMFWGNALVGRILSYLLR